MGYQCPPEGKFCKLYSCRYHLWYEEHGTRQTKAHGDKQHFCCLAEASEGPKTLDEVGEVMHLTRERVRQIEQQAFAKLKRQHPELMAALFESCLDDPL